MYKVKVNDAYQYEIETKGKELLVNGSALTLDFAKINDVETHVLYNNKSFNVEIAELNTNEKTVKLKVNGNLYHLTVEDQFDQLLKQLGLDNLASSKVSEIKAPMPGLVLSVAVAENEEVKKGENLLVLEAMKMENILKSPADGIVKKVFIAQGDKVEKNQILIQFK
ncbi:acetyl-CoA carboxylase biotin carboxyl carrier protein subunit [Pedobacter endophyticus]|uniref:Biotin/lipoyl-binding protein n=1 Tax=Pedobacter endophyticus TaxID=2789740 RepID=A0A7U3Q5P8_9SPHI|nr:acetyl-CoA carboxylase biotin carboxyl carrier protein subunit [Pedobacter endophyticus]QPH38210.1 biotin/lipoyl-binding protein [Pedobacter endophyticus]